METQSGEITRKKVRELRETNNGEEFDTTHRARNEEKEYIYIYIYISIKERLQSFYGIFISNPFHRRGVDRASGLVTTLNNSLSFFFFF